MKKRNTRNWKHITKNHKAYGNWNGVKYETPFMILDEDHLDDKEEGGDTHEV